MTTYQVFGNGGIEYATENARSAAAIAMHYKKRGIEPRLWKVEIPDPNGPVRSVEVTIQSSIDKTAKALVAAQWDNK